MDFSVVHGPKFQQQTLTAKGGGSGIDCFLTKFVKFLKII